MIMTTLTEKMMTDTILVTMSKNKYTTINMIYIYIYIYVYIHAYIRIYTYI